MQPLQDDLRDPAAKDNSITNAATARSNLDAAITMRSAETELQNTELRTTASEIVAPKPDGSRCQSEKKTILKHFLKGFLEGNSLAPKWRKSANKSLWQPSWWEGTWWNLIGLATLELFWHLYLTNLSLHHDQLALQWDSIRFLPLWWPKMKIQEKTMNHDNTKDIPIHESLWMPRTCGLIHPLFNYSGDHKSHEYYGAKGVLMNECSVRMDSPTPWLIILTWSGVTQGARNK